MISGKTYYQLLEISTNASTAEIKKAFRKRAKDIHPDTGSPDTSFTMQDLLEAYNVLSDLKKRSIYDKQWGILKERDKFDYRKFLQDRYDDLESQSKLIFFDLLHKHESDAASLYSKLLDEKGFTLEKYLDREDFMDCSFLLAEEFEKQNQSEEALRLLVTIIKYELEKAYFKHFFEDVILFLRKLVTNMLQRSLFLEEVETALIQINKLPLGVKNNAFFLKKTAELCIAFRDFETARLYVARAEKMDSRLEGLKNIKKQLESA